MTINCDILCDSLFNSKIFLPRLHKNIKYFSKEIFKNKLIPILNKNDQLKAFVNTEIVPKILQSKRKKLAKKGIKFEAGQIDLSLIKKYIYKGVKVQKVDIDMFIQVAERELEEITMEN